MRTFRSKKEIADAIRVQITTNDNSAVRAMLKVYDNQTVDEQATGGVYDFNGVGFAGTDSEILTAFCKQYMGRGWLSEKQMEIIRKKIGKYATQLANGAINQGLYVKQDGVWMVA